jgi:hypothetical protein
MTPEQIALAAQRAADQFPSNGTARSILHAFAAELHNATLAALDGEGKREEWTVATLYQRADGYCGFPVRQDNSTIAVVADADHAHRIAKLPALERAAREAEHALDTLCCSHRAQLYPTEFTEASTAFRTLRAALGEPQPDAARTWNE